MIAETLAYATAVALLVGFAAANVERLLAYVERPRRLAWFGANTIALALPVASLLWAARAPDPLAATLDLRAPDAPAGYAFAWDPVLLWLWASTTILLLLVYLAAWARLASLARRWPRMHSGDTSVLVSSDVGPAVLGILKPHVILPRWIMDAPASLQSTVVAHELEHIGARDQASLVAAQLIAILLPWNLPLWWFARRLRAAIEVDCDARVLRNGVDPGHYADVLLAVGRRSMSSPHAAPALVEPVKHLERRIRIMLSKRPRSATRAATAIALTLGLAACATQLEPPILATSPAPAGAVTQMELDVGEIRRSPNGALITLTAPNVTFGVETTDEARIIAQRLSVNEADETLLFEGDVRIDAANVSIRATRALGRKTPDGGMTWTLYDAAFTPAAADAATLSE